MDYFLNILKLLLIIIINFLNIYFNYNNNKKLLEISHKTKYIELILRL